MRGSICICLRARSSLSTLEISRKQIYESERFAQLIRKGNDCPTIGE